MKITWRDHQDAGKRRDRCAGNGKEREYEKRKEREQTDRFINKEQTW